MTKTTGLKTCGTLSNEIMGMQLGFQKERKGSELPETIIEEIIIGNFPKLIKEVHSTIQEVQQNS